VPPDFLAIGGDAGAASPADPFASGAIPSEPRFLRRVTAAAILQDQGIPFPEGASANYLRATSELVVRNTPGNIEKVEQFVEPLRSRSPAAIHIYTQVFQAPSKIMRQWLQEGERFADQSEVVKKMDAAVGQNGVKVVDAAYHLTKPGTQSTSDAGVQLSSLVNQRPKPTDEVKDEGAEKADDRQEFQITSEQQMVGLRVSFDPVVGAYNVSVDLNLAADYDMARPLLPAEAARADGVLSGPVPVYYKHRSNSNLALRSGTARIVSVWKPLGKPEFNEDLLQALVVRVKLVRPAEEKE
jgi:hypothetical protein